MSERDQNRIDGEYGRLIRIINKAFEGYRIGAQAPEHEALLHEAYLLLGFTSNYHKPWMKRRNKLLSRISELYPDWKNEKIKFEESQ